MKLALCELSSVEWASSSSSSSASSSLARSQQQSSSSDQCRSSSSSSFNSKQFLAIRMNDDDDDDDDYLITDARELSSRAARFELRPRDDRQQMLPVRPHAGLGSARPLLSTGRPLCVRV